MVAPMPLRLSVSFSGVLLVACSVAMFRYASFGTDPFTSFVVGISKISGWRYGVLYMGINIALLCLFVIINRHLIGWATSIAVFMSGYITEGFLSIMNMIEAAPSMNLRIIWLSLAVVVQCIGSALYYEADFGVSAYDACALTMNERFGLPFRWCRVVMDGGCLIVGMSFGVTIGIGTVIAACCMGPLIVMFRRRIALPLLRRGARHA